MSRCPPPSITASLAAPLRWLIPVTSLTLLAIITGCGTADRAPLAGAEDQRAALALTRAGQQLRAELLLPAQGALGFDHRPDSADERDTLQKAVIRLRDGAALLGLSPAAGCQQQTIRVESPLLAVYDDRDRQRPGGAAPLPEDTAVPNDFRALYQFECATPEALRELAPALLEQFPHLQRLVVEWQGSPAGTVDAAHPTLALPPE